MQEKTTVTRMDSWLYAGSVVAFAAYIFRRLLWLQAQPSAYPGAWLDMAALVLSAAALIGLLRIHARYPLRAWPAASAGAASGLIFFISTLGFALANPVNVEWLFHNDWAVHFVGWHFYRNAPWAWPPGAFDTFWYPVGTAIVYTDSLPLLALPLKLVSSVLPPRFQYIGFWLMLNCILQGVFGTLLMRCFTRSFVVQVLGAGMFLLAPVFITRIGHDTLTAHWLILAGLWMYFRPPTGNKRAFAAWFTLAAIAALVHPYLSVMLLALVLAFYLRERYALRVLDDRQTLTYLAAIVAVTTLCWVVSGAFTLHPSAGDIPFGIYNANLLTWFDSQWLSRWLPALPHSGDGQYEGMGYLGPGVFFLAAAAIALTLRSGQSPWMHRPWWPLLLVVAALTLFAFSTRLTFGSHVLLDLAPKHLPLLGVFRGSGRFIWSSAYLITLVVTVAMAQRAGRFAVALLAIAFFAQLLDLSPVHVADARMRIGIFNSNAEQELHDPYWNEAVIGRRHITLVPPLACGKPAAPYFSFSMLAADHGMTINTGYLARFDETRTFAYCDKLKSELDSGVRFADTLYIVQAEENDRFRETSATNMDCRDVEGYTACVIAK